MTPLEKYIRTENKIVCVGISETQLSVRIKPIEGLTSLQYDVNTGVLNGYETFHDGRKENHGILDTHHAPQEAFDLAYEGLAQILNICSTSDPLDRILAKIDNLNIEELTTLNQKIATELHNRIALSQF